MKTGVCSITFRALSIPDVALLVQRAGLDAVEWGGDIHVPHGDLQAALTARRVTTDVGLNVSSYGSYYSPIDANGHPEDFLPVLDVAQTLGADTIRIWAGRTGSAAGSACRNALIDETLRAAEVAEVHGVRLAFEFHNYTFTDTNESAVQLLREINHPNLYTYWQPMYWGPDMNTRIQGLTQLKDKILNLHVFHWHYDSSKEQLSDAIDRRPLEEGAADWKSYLSIPPPEKERFALIEFVRHNDPNQFLQDAAVLRRWTE